MRAPTLHDGRYRYTSYLVHSLRACMTLARVRVAMRALLWPVGRTVGPSVSRHWRLDHWTGPGRRVSERARTFGRARQLWLDNKRRRRRQRFRRCRADGMHEKRYIPTRGAGERERGRKGRQAARRGARDDGTCKPHGHGDCIDPCDVCRAVFIRFHVPTKAGIGFVRFAE